MPGKRERPKSAYAALNLRMKEPLRAALEKAADENGLSMNSEAVHRLAQSFEVFGPPHVKDMAMQVAKLVAITMQGVEMRTGSKTTEDVESFRALQMALAGFFGLPFGESKVSEESRQIGEAVARDALLNLCQDESRVDEWLDRLTPKKARRTPRKARTE